MRYCEYAKGAHALLSSPLPPPFPPALLLCGEGVETQGFSYTQHADPFASAALANRQPASQALLKAAAGSRWAVCGSVAVMVLGPGAISTRPKGKQAGSQSVSHRQTIPPPPNCLGHRTLQHTTFITNHPINKFTNEKRTHARTKINENELEVGKNTQMDFCPVATLNERFIQF